jgi:hypothetical protein
MIFVHQRVKDTLRTAQECRMLEWYLMKGEDMKGSGIMYLRYIQPSFQKRLTKIRKPLSSQDNFMEVQDLVLREMLAYILVCRHLEKAQNLWTRISSLADDLNTPYTSLIKQKWASQVLHSSHKSNLQSPSHCCSFPGRPIRTRSITTLVCCCGYRFTHCGLDI